jgi:hypothetical protein
LPNRKASEDGAGRRNSERNGKNRPRADRLQFKHGDCSASSHWEVRISSKEINNWDACDAQDDTVPGLQIRFASTSWAARKPGGQDGASGVFMMDS